MSHDLLAAGLSAVAGPPDRQLWKALLPIAVLAVAFDVYCLVDVIRAKSVRRLPKAGWAAVIVMVSAPWGGLLYLFLGRDRGQRSTGQP
jgi:hypothetical protein